MSNYWIRFIPADPQQVPGLAQREAAQEWLTARFPSADEITATLFTAVQFIDQGGNFERVVCSLCGVECTEWWGQAMDDTYQDGFHGPGFYNLMVTTGCCGREVSLNDLKYELPAGFARFVLDVKDPWQERDLKDPELKELEQVIGCSLRRIWDRI